MLKLLPMNLLYASDGSRYRETCPWILEDEFQQVFTLSTVCLFVCLFWSAGFLPWRRIPGKLGVFLKLTSDKNHHLGRFS